MSLVVPHLNLVAAITTLGLLISFVWRRKIPNYLVPFYILAASFLAWQTFDYTAFCLRNFPQEAFFFKKIAFFAAAFIPAVFYHFSRPPGGRDFLPLMVLYLFSSVLGILALCGMMFSTMSENVYGLVAMPGRLYMLWIVYAATVFVLSVLTVAGEMKKSRIFLHTERLKYVMLGMILSAFSGLDLIPLSGLLFPPLGFIFLFFAIICISYVVLDEEPLEFRIFMNRLSGYSGVYVLMFVLLSLVIYLTLPAAERGGFEETLMSLFAASLLLFLVLMLLLPLKEGLVSYLDKISLGSWNAIDIKSRSFVQELSAFYDADQLLARVVNFFNKVLGFPRVSFLLLDEGRNSYKVVEGHMIGNPGITFMKDDDFTRWLSKENRVVSRDDMEMLLEEKKETISKVLDAMDAAYCLPVIRTAGKKRYLLGFIVLGGPGALDFRMKSNRALLESLRWNISYFLYQSLMSKKRRDELLLLSRFRERVLSAEAAQEVLSYLVETIHEFMHVERISVMLLDEDKKSSLVIKESYGIPEEIKGAVSIDPGDDRKVSGWVFKNNRALLTDNVEQDFDVKEKKQSQYSTRSCISAPLAINGVPFGVINVNNKISGEPFDVVDLEVLKGLSNEASISLLWAQMRQVDQTRVENLVRTLAKTLEAKDPFTQGHADRVAEYAGYIASEMNLPPEQYAILLSAGSLHDIGKLSIPDAVLLKPGKLTDEEFAVIKSHSKSGENILRQANLSEDILLGVKHHHERYDGRGYPDGLKGEDIPLLARILAVADAFDAMMSNRAYRKKMKFSAVKEQIVKNRGTQFDPACADIFLKWLDENAPPDDEDIDNIELEGQMQQRKYGDPPAAG